MQTINYNPMLLMLYNLEPNVLVVSKFSDWDQNEENLIQQGIKFKKTNQSLAIMNLESIEELLEAIYPFKTISFKAQQKSTINYFIQYIVNELKLFKQIEIFQFWKSLLNVQQVVLNKELLINHESINLKQLEEVFGKENVLVVNYILPKQNFNLIKTALKDGNVKTFFEITNTYYSFKGTVIHGKKLGRILGYPTTNVLIPKKFPLKDGVYYSQVKLPNDETLYDGMSSIWTNESQEHLIETYLFNFEKDIYQWNIEINFIDFIRDNVKVKNQEELINLLKKDEKYIQVHFLNRK